MWRASPCCLPEHLSTVSAGNRGDPSPPPSRRTPQAVGVWRGKTAVLLPVGCVAATPEICRRPAKRCRCAARTQGPSWLQLQRRDSRVEAEEQRDVAGAKRSGARSGWPRRALSLGGGLAGSVDRDRRGRTGRGFQTGGQLRPPRRYSFAPALTRPRARSCSLIRNLSQGAHDRRPLY